MPNERFSTRMFRPSVLRCSDDPVDGGDHLGDVDRAVGCRDLHVDEPRAGRDADEAALRRLFERASVERDRRVAAGDDAGHVRAVAELVDAVGGVAGAEREVRAVHDVAGELRAVGATPESITATSTPAPV